jgi:hypothetical protein
LLSRLSTNGRLAVSWLFGAIISVLLLPTEGREKREGRKGARGRKQASKQVAYVVPG